MSSVVSFPLGAEGYQNIRSRLHPPNKAEGATEQADRQSEGFVGVHAGFPVHQSCLFAVWLYMFPWWLRGWRIGLQCGRPGFDPWIRKILWRRERQPTPVFLPASVMHSIMLLNKFAEFIHQNSMHTILGFCREKELRDVYVHIFMHMKVSVIVWANYIHIIA